MPCQTFEIVCDGSCDLPLSLLRERGIAVVPYYVSFQEEIYRREALELPVREFYQKLVEAPGVYPKTSMPTPQDYYEVFSTLVQRGRRILCICMTALFSGSFQSAQCARELVLEEYEEADITIIDSALTTALEGIYALEAADMRDDGLSLPETTALLEELKTTGRIFFTVGSMSHLLRGGRAGKLSGKVLDRVDIKPMICMKNGEIHPAGFRRSRESAIQQVISMAENYLDSLGDKAAGFRIVTGFGHSEEEGIRFNHLVWERLGKRLTCGQIDSYQIGATIAVHTGAYPLGIGCIRNYSRKKHGDSCIKEQMSR